MAEINTILPAEVSKENPAKLDRTKRESLLEDTEFIKESKCDKWSDDEKTHFKEKGFRAFRENEKPIISLTARPSDYDNDLKRGSVHIHENLKNYSFCTVTIPDGSTIENQNFTQVQPDTDCIIGENITFIDCNLSNVRINPSWTLQDCNTAQFWLVEEEIEGKMKNVTQFICSHPSELPESDTKIPANVIISKEY